MHAPAAQPPDPFIFCGSRSIVILCPLIPATRPASLPVRPSAPISRHKLLPASPVNILLGIFLKIVSALAFTAMATIIKLVSDSYPTGQIVFFRSFFALIPLLAWLAMRGELIDAVRTHKPWSHLRRSLAGSLGMFCGFAALSLLPLPDATAIGYATPLLTTALAAIILKEKVRHYRWSALGIGFIGMLIMMIPISERAVRRFRSRAGRLWVRSSACSARRARRWLPSRFAGWRRSKRPGRSYSISHRPPLCSVRRPFPRLADADAARHDSADQRGHLPGIGQILMTSSFRYAPVSVIAPFDYMSLLWALIVGFLVFGDIPQPLVVAGAGLVVAAGLFVIWRERQLGIEMRREREAGSHRQN